MAPVRVRSRQRIPVAAQSATVRHGKKASVAGFFTGESRDADMSGGLSRLQRRGLEWRPLLHPQMMGLDDLVVEGQQRRVQHLAVELLIRHTGGDGTGGELECAER